MADGWQGRHTLDVPVVVVTHRVPTDWVDAHPDAPFTFVTDGVEAAVAQAQELAGDRVVAVTGGTIARQCLDLGLLDEVAVDLVPVVMGEGNRPFFGKLSSDDVLLGNPTVCVPGRPGHPPRVPGAAMRREPRPGVVKQSRADQEGPARTRSVYGTGRHVSCRARLSRHCDQPVGGGLWVDELVKVLSGQLLDERTSAASVGRHLFDDGSKSKLPQATSSSQRVGTGTDCS